MVHRTSRFFEVIELLNKYQLTPKRIQFILCSATIAEEVKKLAESVNANRDTNQERFKDFLKKIVGDQIDSKNLDTEKDRVILKGNKALEITDDYQGDASKDVRIIIADEAETLNELELQALSKYGDKHNVFILALGDFNQPTPKIRINGSLNGSGIEDCYVLKTPLLSTSLRALSVAKTDNANKLFNLVNDVSNSKLTNPEYLEQKALNNYLETKLKLGITLKYYESDSRTVGDRIISDENEFKTNLDKAIASGSKVRIIVDENTESKYQSSKYKSLAIRVEEALGGEFDYVFVDISHDWNDLFGELQMLYMLTQRSTLYTAVLDTQDDIRRHLNIKTVPDENSSGIIRLSDVNLKQYKDWWLGLLKDLTPSDNFEVNLSTNTIVRDPVDVGSEEKSEETPPPADDSESEEDTAKDETDNTSEESEVVDEEEKPKINKPKPNLRKPNTTPIKNNVKPETDETQVSLFDEDDDSTPVDMITSTIKIGSVTLDRHYETIFSDTFKKEERSNPNSLYNRLNRLNRNTVNNRYGEIIASISMIALQGKNPTDIKSAIYSCLRNKFALNTDDVVEFLRSQSNFNILFNAKKDGSDIILRLYSENNNKNFIDIKIGESKVRKSGIYTGTFTKTSGPQFEDGDHITLAQLLRKYPALNLTKAIGVLIGATTQNYYGSEEFGDRNDGKSFVAVGELTDGLEPKDIFKASESEGKTWTYDHSDILRLIGVQKILTSEEVCKVLVYQDYLRWGIDNPEYGANNKRRIKHLKYFGVYNDNTVDREKILNELADITGNKDWLLLDGSISEQTRNNLLNKEFLATPNVMSQVFGSIFNEIFSNPANYSDNENSIWYALRYLLCDDVDGRRMYIETSDRKTYYIKTVNTSDKKFPTYWELYDIDGNLKSKINTSSIVGPQIARALKNLIDSAGIDLSNARVIFKYLKDGEWVVHNTNRVFLSLLSPFIENSSKIDKFFSGFKYGFYANIKGESEQHDCWKLTSILDTLDKYSTRASTWHYSTYDIDESEITDLDNSVNVDRLFDFKNYSEDVIRVAKTFVQEDILREIIDSYENREFNSGEDVMTAIEEIVNSINDYILANTTLQYTKTLVWDTWTGIPKIVNRDTYDYAVKNLLFDLGFNIDSLEIVHDYNGVRVITDAESDAFVYVENGEVKVKRTGSKDAYVDAFNQIRELYKNNPFGSEEENKVINRTKGKLLTFLNNFVKNAITSEDVDSLLKDFSNSDALNVINTFIETYLNSEIDEC